MYITNLGTSNSVANDVHENSVPNVLAKGVETINKQTQQTSAPMAYKIHKT